MACTMHAFSHFLFSMFFALLLCLSFPSQSIRAQADREIAALVERVKRGGGEEVARLLPTLQKSHPDKAGVLYLEALLATNAEKAVALYQRIADEYAQSSWADDALHRLYQYSYAVGAYRTARSYSERIAKEHPRSSLAKDRLAAEGKERVAPAVPGGSVKNVSAEKSAAGETAVRSTATPGGAAGGASYAVQVGAYKRVSDARTLMDDLKTKGYTAYLREKTVRGKTYQAVWLGVFPDSVQAQAFARRLKSQQNIDAIVVRR